MAEVERETRCATHPNELAVAACDHCGKPFCGPCRVEEVGAEEVFCSQFCRTERAAGRPAPIKLSEDALIEGFEAPIRTGWRVWWGSIPALSKHIAPLALLIGLLTWREAEAPEQGGEGGVEALLVLLLLVFGIALTQAEMTSQYTGLIQGNLYVWTLRRFVPWLVTEALVLLLTLVGLLAFVVPGLILGLRLFWADELAMVHQMAPHRALKESWDLTRGGAGSMFKVQFFMGLAAYLMLIVGGLVLVMIFSGLAAIGRPDWFAPLELALLYLIFFIGYAGIHAPEVVYFYGVRARQSRSPRPSTKVLTSHTA